ncbi:MAG: hypothetical protein QOG00_3879 [Pyrinomonadaceae bacterium]|jgi:hypothetical protein|nr:hypothetical protein [Pyrinomonadaceae bacterium]MDQ1613948.1 hypothetical protein [Pyrinomonadaceae bacterium]MDX6269481.1 hypothetical protein [Acidobacteriota bacterium]
MNSNGGDRWVQIELLLLRLYLLFQTGSGLLEMVTQKVREMGHTLSLW